MKKELTSEFIKQNLEDAGCDCDVADCILECCECGDTIKAKKMIRQHRENLLNEVHKGYKKIDCLDYLSYQIEKEEGQQQKEKKQK